VRQAVGQALLDLGLSPERPLAILSGNDLEHLTLALGAHVGGRALCTVSTAYSLVSQDFGKLRHILATSTPGLVFAATPRIRPRHAAVVPKTCPWCSPKRRGGGGRPQGARPSAACWPRCPARRWPGRARRGGPGHHRQAAVHVGQHQAAQGRDHTQRMLCANQQQLRQCLGFLAEEPPVLVDWLPWNHVFGGSHNVGITLYNGGTLYIDDGKPTPAGMAETLRNLREISPTVYFNVPKGLEEIAAAMDTDTLLRDTLFKRCKAFMFAGAALARRCGTSCTRTARRRWASGCAVITGLGMTETAPSCTFAVGTDVARATSACRCRVWRSSWCPTPGCGKLEIRFQGPQRDARLLARARADGRGLRRRRLLPHRRRRGWIDPTTPERGLLLRRPHGRGLQALHRHLRQRGPAARHGSSLAGDPCVQDAVITG
jgi:feruloyl-CoA synthase